ncbi:lysylphosphatidylglycerol synthase domain-containing protein [Modestobacter sp. VKM Ac-2986]|uniref:lysylphosphatidylglycerol synthase domain-containing protein n=1 Tax=Modestobacter sp. VKM Ac-2986 TaxID=3004140 RepID=UPI0022AB9A98|nr:lysylphosphatidylglycerol synthase domain-containing protein [Modestobacter sp. VKM Ac-2986]MCZ2829745.1 lysylphosphatidylglycerol synthase domain-containing protein [Modestobacter sp. VKM Ac-2986]
MSHPYSRGRVALIVVALLSLAGFLLFNLDALSDLWTALADSLDGGDWAVIGAAAVVQLLGHVLRAARTKVPLDNVRRGSLAGQFRHLTIGYLFNVVWPLRIGEVVRAWLIAKTVRISFLYTLLAVILERLIDVVFVSVILLVFVAVVGVPEGGVVPITAVVALVVAVALIVAFVAFVRENSFMLRVAWRASSWLNNDLENRLRFKLWSVIFGFQRFFRQRRQLVRYGVLALVSWVCYLAAAVAVAVTVLPALSGRQAFIAATAPSAVVGPAIGNGAPGGFVDGVVEFVERSGGLGGRELLVFAGASWVVANVPVLVIAVVALFVNWARRTSDPLAGAPLAAQDRYVNKLAREQDVSGRMTHFLDSYFRGQHLSQVMHRLEVNGNVSLVQFFKGGSNAVTLLATSGGELFVKKMVPTEHAHRLKNQYDWLAERADHPLLVTVLREEHADDHYAIDLEYRPSSVPLFEYVHEQPLAESAAKLAQVWDYMYGRVYDLGELEEHPDVRDDYVSERFVRRVQAAAESHPALAEAMKSDRILVNGQELDNFATILDRITANETAWRDLATYRTSAHIHGDLTVDNILVDLPTRDVLVIDPSDDNQVRGPIIDFARHMQSLLYGYEFLNEDESPVLLGARDGMPEITYRDDRSARYAELADFVSTEVIPRHLSVAEQRSVLFHVGLFYGRMLTHRVVINSGTVLKYYGVCLQALNRFLDQYDLPRRDDRGDDLFGIDTRSDQVLSK